MLGENSLGIDPDRPNYETKPSCLFFRWLLWSRVAKERPAGREGTAALPAPQYVVIGRACSRVLGLLRPALLRRKVYSRRRSVVARAPPVSPWLPGPRPSGRLLQATLLLCTCARLGKDAQRWARDGKQLGHRRPEVFCRAPGSISEADGTRCTSKGWEGDDPLVRVGVFAIVFSLVVILVAVVLADVLRTTPKTVYFSLSGRRALLRSVARSNLEVARDFVRLHTYFMSQLGEVDCPVLPMEGIAEAHFGVG